MAEASRPSADPLSDAVQMIAAQMEANRLAAEQAAQQMMMLRFVSGRHPILNGNVKVDRGPREILAGDTLRSGGVDYIAWRDGMSILEPDRDPQYGFDVWVERYPGGTVQNHFERARRENRWWRMIRRRSFWRAVGYYMTHAS